ncbi:hypothetical protein NIES4071_99410 [Calothrix sp. NIES-4071]|nr:hypothetical protein NIES4071_99410 [Calothrix sp. NIES-4071]BAZ64204.1 hypothetical protein NIES4105_99340 [Calothrix sp. NIES-4105]
MINKLFLRSAAVITLLCSTSLTLNSNSASASTQPNTATAISTTYKNKAGKKLAPGTYCYSAKTKTLDASATVNISATNKVNGTVQATIQNPAESYYTSYQQTLTGELAGDKAKLRIVTKIENDTQNTQATWTITESSLNTGRESFTRAKCGASSEETAPTRKAVRIKFANGTNSKTIEQSVIRGERDTYLVGAKRGQRMNLKITSLEKNAAFDVIAPDGKTIKEGVTTWSGKLPANGDYKIVVGGTRGNASYKLTVEIK